MIARMAKIRDEGTPAARHLVEDLWEARVDGLGVTHRIPFTEEGAKARILLAICRVHQEDPEDATSHHQYGAQEARRVAVPRGFEVTGKRLTISVITDTLRPGGSRMDDLDRAINRRTAKNPNFRKLLAAETRRLDLISSLVALRKKNGLSQADVAREMGVGQSVVAEIESGQIDVRYTTLDRYVSAVSREKARLTIGRVRAVGGQA